MLIEQAKTKAINEAEFYLVIGAKVKAMDRERRERNEIKVKLPIE